MEPESSSSWHYDDTYLSFAPIESVLHNFLPVSVEFSLPTQTADTLNQLGLFQAAPILSCSRPSPAPQTKKPRRDSSQRQDENEHDRHGNVNDRNGNVNDGHGNENDANGNENDRPDDENEDDRQGDHSVPEGTHAVEEEEYVLDCVFFTGGLVWRMAWLPLEVSRGPSPVEYLFVSVHPKRVTRNNIGAALHGLGMVQIWAVPSSSRSPFGANCAPVLVGGIIHEGVVTWDLACCPDMKTFLRAQGTLDEPSSSRYGGLASRCGLVALAQGNGSIQVYSVPNFERYAGQSLEEFKPLFYRMQAHVHINFAHSRGSLPSSLAWHPSPPHEFLLVGFWDGSAAMIKFTPATQGTPAQQAMPLNGPAQHEQSGSDSGGSAYQVLFHIQCDVLGLRKVAWLQCEEPSFDGVEKRLFLTGANSGRLKIWDVWDLNASIVEKLLYRSWITDAVCTPNSILASLEDGTVRQFIFDPNYYASTPDTGVHVFKGTNNGCVWAVAYNPHLQVIAYCGDDGVVGMTALRNCTDSRHRKPHAAWGGLKQEGASLRMVDAQHLVHDTGLFTGAGRGPGNRRNDESVGNQTLPAENQALYALGWSPNGRQVTWLASGGKAGLVRCQRFSSRTTVL